MSTARKIFTYTNGRQVFVMPDGYERQVSYHMWAGGGGAGGDSGAFTGGNGAAGTYLTGSFNADPGDRIEVIVGGGGQEGRSLDANKKLYSCTIEGTGASGVGPTASYGFVNDPTKAIYPRYNDPLAALSVGAPDPKNTPKFEVLENKYPAPAAPPAGRAVAL